MTKFDYVMKEGKTRDLLGCYKTWEEYFQVYSTEELLKLQKKISKELLRRLQEEDR